MLLPDWIMQLLQNTLHTVGIVALCVVAAPPLLAVLVPLGIGGWHVFQQFRAIFRELKRMESGSRTPIYATFGETLSGLETIRAFSACDRFRRLMRERIDKNSEHFLMFRSVRMIAFSTVD